MPYSTGAGIKLSLTATGYAFCGALALMLLVAINYQNSLAYMLCFWLLSLMGVTAWHTYNNLKGVGIVCLESPPVFAGDEARFYFSIRQQDQQTRCHAVQMAWLESSTLELQDLDCESQITLSLPSERRGWLCAKPIRLESSFPLGFFKARVTVPAQGRVLVYPQPMAIPLGMQSVSLADGDSVKFGAGDYQGVRAWRSGESMQRLDWKAFSRDQGFWVKHFLEPIDDPEVLNFEALQGHTEQRLSVLCAAVLRLTREHQPFVLLLSHERFGPSMGYQHQVHCLQALALYGQGEAL